MMRIVVEEDHFLKILPVILDPATPDEHQRGVADFFAHDMDLMEWCADFRARIPGLYPAQVSFAKSQAEFDAALTDADAAVCEGFTVADAGLRHARRLKVVHKFGYLTPNIDRAACAAHGVAVHTVRRRGNVAVAEQAFVLMAALAKRICEHAGVVEADSLAKLGFPLRPYDRRYIGNSNFARIPNLRTLMGATLGIVGMGEVGREIAARARAFEMNILYYQRTKLTPGEEAKLGMRYSPLDDLMAASDYIILQLPLNDSTRHIIGRAQFQRMKPGAILVNAARAALMERGALIEALDSGLLAGLGLDVGYTEPALPDDPLLKYKNGNVILMPHTAVGDRRVGLADLEEMCLNIWREVTRD